MNQALPDSSRPTVLVFAGADPSGGAGIGADIQAIAAQGAHALPVITALTVQDNDRVYEVVPVASDVVRRQARALIDKIGIDAVKIGIPGSRGNAETIAMLIAELRLKRPNLPVVLDPVLASGAGDALAREDACHVLSPLVPLASVIVPNLPEANALCGSAASVAEQAASLLARGCGDVLVTGGHADGAMVVNRWFGAHGEHEWRWPRLAGEFHGSGCTLASAIAARLACGDGIELALATAQAYCHEALADSFSIAAGQRIPLRSARPITSTFQGTP
jgi:hydroxymethylpyrimidine/phosphomethylpyrimidine kinase